MSRCADDVIGHRLVAPSGAAGATDYANIYLTDSFLSDDSFYQNSAPFHVLNGSYKGWSLCPQRPKIPVHGCFFRNGLDVSEFY